MGSFACNSSSGSNNNQHKCMQLAQQMKEKKKTKKQKQRTANKSFDASWAQAQLTTLHVPRDVASSYIVYISYKVYKQFMTILFTPVIS